jgi:peptide/nickel transport system permease protein
MLISVSIAFLLIFFLVYLSPGKQYYQVLNPNTNETLIKKMASEQNVSVVTEFTKYTEKILSGQPGVSSRYHQNISELIFVHIKVTVLLSLAAFLLQFILSLFLSYYSLKYKGKIFERTLDKLTSVLYSLPTIVTAPFLIIIFSVILKIFPSSGLSGFSEQNNIIETFYYLSLPVMSLALSFIPEYYKYLTEVLEDLSNNTFITYLKSLGVSKTKIFISHIFPNSMNTILSVVGIDLGLLLSGALITEIIFGIPGFGRLTYESIWAKDYYLAITCGIYGSVSFILINFFTDILRVIIDKRTLASLQ